MLLVLNVIYYGKIATHIAKDIHKSKGWASQWLKRYREEGIEGLKDRPKGGRHPKIQRQIEYRIMTILKESNQGWTTKQVEKMIIEKSGIKYNHNYIYYILHRWVLNRKYQGKYMLIQHQRKRKRISKKDRTDTCGYPVPNERLYFSVCR